MKNYTRKKVPFKYLLMFLFTFSSTAIWAQCPTLNNAAPTVCNGAGFKVQDLAMYITDNGGGIRYYENATSTNAINPNDIVKDGDVYFIDSNTNQCGTRQSITVSFTVKPTGATIFNNSYCSNDNPTLQNEIDDELASSIPPGGSVKIYSNSSLATELPTTAPITTTLTPFYIVYSDSSGCTGQFEIGLFQAQQSSPDPTPQVIQDICLDPNPSPTIADLTPAPSSTIKWYATSTANIGNNLPDNTALTNGTTYYVRDITNFDCPSNAVPSEVKLSQPNNAGTPGEEFFCFGQNVPTTPINLIDYLGGTKDSGGTWTGPLTTTNGDQGSVNFTGQPANQYVFTYTITSTTACPDVSQTVTVTITETLEAGTASTTEKSTYCESELPNALDLFTLVNGEDAGGKWTVDGNTITSPYNASGLTPGSHNFVYTQNALPNTCNEDTATFTLTVLADPLTGVSTLQPEYCTSDPFITNGFDLFTALDGSQVAGGTWTDNSNTGQFSGNTVNLKNLGAGTFSFTYTVDNGTCTGSTTVTFNITNGVFAGTTIHTSANPLEFCLGDPAFNGASLFDLIENEEAGGEWTYKNNPGFISDPTNFNVGIPLGANNFTYTIKGTGACPDSKVTVFMNVLAVPNAGTDNPPAPICENGSNFDLFDAIDGEDGGGTWSDDDNSNGLTGSIINPANITPGVYNFTYSVTNVNNCTSTNTVAITIADTPEPGTPIATMPTICLSTITTGQKVELLDLINGENTPGIWSDNDTTGQLSGSEVTISGLAVGTYNFTYNVDPIITGATSCDVPNTSNPTVSFTITDTAAPAVDTTQSFCDTATIANLSTTGGTSVVWYATATATTPLSTASALENGFSYFAAQTLTNCESAARTKVDVTIVPSPNSGTAIPLTVCNNAIIDLTTALNGSQNPGGTWADDNATGKLTGSMFDATGITPGDYKFTYTVIATSPCTNASTTVTITVQEPVNAGADAITAICYDQDPTTVEAFDLFTLLSGQTNNTGDWSFNGAVVSNTFDPAINESGIYTYTIASVCNVDTATIEVTKNLEPYAGENTTVNDYCLSSDQVTLSSLLNNATGLVINTTGTWTQGGTTVADEFKPTAVGSIVYEYTVAGTAPCKLQDVSTLTINVIDTPAPTVVAGADKFCKVDNATVADLDATVTGTNLVWFDTETSTTPLISTEVLVDGQDYWATQQNTSCTSNSRTVVTITINDTNTPTLKTDGNLFCINDGPTLAELTQNIVETNTTGSNVVWYSTATGGTALSSSDKLTQFATYYAVLIDPATLCESSIRLEVTVDLTSGCDEILIPDGLSPNGDGVNDVFLLQNIEVLFPNYEIQIFNRYGSVVYQGNKSTDPFSGTANKGTLLGTGELPVGVYYYIIDFNDGKTEPKKGPLYLNR